MTTKVCGGCLIEKNIELFSIRRSGHMIGKPRSRCKECEAKAIMAYRDNDREAARRIDREWRKNNPDKVRAIKQRWAKAHPEKVKELNSSLSHKRSVRAWEKNNPEKVRAKARARSKRMRLLDDPVSLEYGDIVLCDPCSYCALQADTVDHIVPSSSGGTHEWTNLTGSCRSCNSSKNAKPLLNFLLDRRPHELAAR